MWSGFVNNSQQVWQTYLTAKQFRTRPSELLAVADPWVAYCLDNAVGLFGSTLEAELEAVEGKTNKEINGKRTRIMEKWLDMPRRFRSPLASTKKIDVVQEFTVKGEVD